MKLNQARRILRSIALHLLLPATAVLSGCETVHKLGEGFGHMGDKALETIGIRRPEVAQLPELAESARPSRPMKLRIAASDALNVDDAGRSLTLVVRVYKLRSPASFLNASHEVFGHAAKEKEALADELIESRELLLLPGRHQQLSERWAREATHVGVVALFRAPAPMRWRYAFELKDLPQDDTIFLGAHACMLSVAAGTAVGLPDDADRFIGSACNASRAHSSSLPLQGPS